MAVSGYHSRWKFYFRLLVLVFVVLIFAWIGLQASIFWTNKTISEKEQVLSGQNTELQNYKSLTGFVKLQAVKELEGQYTDIPRSTHIQKVVSMLNDIKSLAAGQDQTLVLSDFTVSLDKLSVRGKVSSLLLLYYTNPEKGIVSLIDRFKTLDFISNMRIKNYSKDNGFFSFVLEANVNDNGK